MSEQNPIRVFVTHAWAEDEDYVRVFEFLESSPNFYYRSCGSAESRGVSAGVDDDIEEQREALRVQMRPAELVIATAGLLRQHSSLLVFQMTFARSASKSVLLLPEFGVATPIPKGVQNLATETVGWDERALVGAIRRLARGEETGRWDTVEFSLD